MTLCFAIDLRLQIYRNFQCWSNKIFRSSRPEVFCKKRVLRNFAKFRGKHLCQSLFFNKVADLKPATFLKKRLWHRCFPVNFAEFLRTSFLTEHLRWLLLNLRFNCFLLNLREQESKKFTFFYLF